MYGALSPIFDVPELPMLRRVKPLPKRRRTSEPSQNDDGRQHMPGVPPGMLDASPEELIAHADALSAQMALQSYYMPVLGGMRDLFAKDLVAPSSTPIDLGGSTFGMGDFRGGQDEDEFGEGDYMEHLQQPGNTKKRKVPANMSGGAHGRDSGGNSGAEDEPSERGVPTGGRTDREYDATGDRHGAVSAGALMQKRGKLPKATLAGLQHKELLRTRKRQLHAVIGQLSQQGDTLALDQALSASYPFARLTLSDKPPPPLRVRLSRRKGPRLARAFRAFRAALPPNTYEPKIVVPPEADFLFACDSLTSKRLIATKEEVAALHARFEEEFTRQAVKAAEAAKQAAAALNGPLLKRTERSKGRGARGADGKSASLEQSLLNGKAGSGKKKKRSALANASNPHHLRNYVPSRVPNSGQVNTAQNIQNAQNLLSPPPIRFLSADLPPRRRKKSERPVAPVPSLTNPVDEWICPFCEFNLFYGDELAYQRAIRNRKKILRRRRRARERAAAAASGGSAAKASEKDVSPADDAQPAAYDTAAYETNAAASGKQGSRWKDERERGGHGHVYDGGANGGLG
ncbi:hypothetical protein DAEQUDRAFT_764355 [Daedalea quercina L-15889]|uniref:Uncharacterized protein n=1 Tax=Daedalea quercina L-15889 TaxID=1314783 RepID=A0A165RI56_9APHY|nr:hypothetical protein DAEQUDRAFT_764355 [Daedalea quercina L-15889]